MRFRADRKKNKWQYDWHDYFVWRPRKIFDNDTETYFWVWLETVRRIKMKLTSNWKYRLKD
jgi:hypothetical protein